MSNARGRIKPADLVIGIWGIRPLARELGVQPSSILRWRSTIGGQIPMSWQRPLLQLAKKHRVRLTDSEIIWGR